MKRVLGALALVLASAGSGAPWVTAVLAEPRHVVTVLSLSDALDPSLLDRFSQESGVEVLVDGLATPDALAAALRSPKQSYDLALLPLASLAGLLKGSLLAPIDAGTNAVPSEPRLMAAVAAQAGSGFALPFDWYPMGFAVNTAKLKGVGVTIDPGAGWDILRKPEVLRTVAGCGLGVPDQPLGLHALAIAATGGTDQPPNVLDRRRALATLTQLRLLGKIGTEAESADALAQGESCAAILSAPAAFLAAARARITPDGANLDFVLPAGGSMLTVDVLVLPAAGRNQSGGLALLGFLLQPEHAAQNARYGHVAPAFRGGSGLTADAFVDMAALPRLMFPGAPDPSLDRAVETEWRRGANH